MTRRRLVAAAGAAALIVAAFLVRTLVLDDGDDDPGTQPGGSGSNTTAVCATELAAACRAAGFAEVTVEAAGVTADRLGGGRELGADVWVTTTPWPQMVTEVRRQDARMGVVGPPLASTQLVVLAPSRWFDQLKAPCESFTWRCVGERGGDPSADPPRQPVVGLAVDGAESSTGLLTVGALTTGWFDGHRPADELALADIEDDPELDTWLRAVATSRPALPGTDAALARILRTPTIAAAATALAAQASDVRGAFTHAAPGPLVTTHAVVAGDLQRALSERLARELRARGWDEPADPDAPTGLPNSGVMVQLRKRWSALTR